MSYDLVIRGGTVVDGSGGERFGADVGIRDGRIVTVGRVTEKGRVEVDADGHFVTPGFIDGHTHLDAQVFWDPMGTSACWHGVTTAVMGNCGFTLAPCREDQADLVLRSLERAEDMDRKTLVAGVRWQWETFPEFLDVVDGLPKGINYAAYVGHSALRSYVMGERSFTEPATDDEIDLMRRHVREALEAGAIGFSTSRNYVHRTRDDQPVASRLATWDEVCRLVDVMRETRRGVFEIVRPEEPGEDDAYTDYLAQLRDLTVESGRLCTFSCTFNDKRPQFGFRRLRALEETHSAGGCMVGQVSTREFASVIGFKTRLPYDQLPLWASMRAQPLAAQRAALTDPVQRERLVHEAMAGGFAEGMSTEVRAPDYAAMHLLERADGGPCRNVAEVAAERGCTPVDVVVDYALETDFDGLYQQAVGNQNPDNIEAGLRHPNTVVAVSDTGAHVSQIIDSSMPTYLIAHWVRDRAAFTWEEGVRMLTADPAAVWGLRDRGLLREGYAADIVVFDPDAITPDVPTVAVDLPGGGKRLVQRASGIRATVVGGEVVAEDGEFTGALPGRLLRGTRDES